MRGFLSTQILRLIKYKKITQHKLKRKIFIGNHFLSLTYSRRDIRDSTKSGCVRDMIHDYVPQWSSMCHTIYYISSMLFWCTIKSNDTTITSSLHIQDNQGGIKKSISSLCVSNIMELRIYYWHFCRNPLPLPLHEYVRRIQLEIFCFRLADCCDGKSFPKLSVATVSLFYGFFFGLISVESENIPGFLK